MAGATAETIHARPNVIRSASMDWYDLTTGNNPSDYRNADSVYASCDIDFSIDPPMTNSLPFILKMELIKMSPNWDFNPMSGNFWASHVDAIERRNVPVSLTLVQIVFIFPNPYFDVPFFYPDSLTSCSIYFTLLDRNYYHSKDEHHINRRPPYVRPTNSCSF